ncbi:hypothetical protein Tco_1277676 [Tanacetum coccineum]
MAGYKQSQLKNKSFAEIQKLFNISMTRVNMFVDMDTDWCKRAQRKLKQRWHKKVVLRQQEKNDEVAIDAIPLATKPARILIKSFDREDLETLWKLVKAKHVNTRLEECYERVLWGDLKTMFEYMHVYMLVEKKYPLTPATITDMLNKKLKSDYWNEMCYQLLNLMTKQLKKQIKSLLEVTAAKVRVTAVKHNLVLLINFDETYAK